MSAREATAQQIDPLGALNQRPITIVIALFALVLSGVRTVVNDAPGQRPFLAVLAVVFVAAGVLVLVIASSPLRAPLRRSRFAAILVLGILAMVTTAFANGGHDTMVRDDWGPTAVGLLILACSPYRPGRDLMVGTIVGAFLAAVVIWYETPFFTTQAPVLVFLAVGVTPLLALGVGASVYSSSFVSQVERWLTRATRLTRESAIEMRPGIARSVQQDRVTSLNRDVVPFFSRLVASAEVTQADVDEAGAVATLIRGRIVDEADRTWLEQALLDVCPRGQAGTVVDRAHLADAMTSDQRTSVRALVNAMASDDATRTSSLGIVLHDDAPLVRALIRIESSSTDLAARQRYAPYFAVLRILFADLHVDENGSFLTLRFSYDQH